MVEASVGEWMVPLDWADGFSDGYYPSTIWGWLISRDRAWEDIEL